MDIDTVFLLNILHRHKHDIDIKYQ